MTSDPELPPVDTPYCHLEYLTVVGVARKVEYATKQWSLRHDLAPASLRVEQLKRLLLTPLTEVMLSTR